MWRDEPGRATSDDKRFIGLGGNDLSLRTGECGPPLLLTGTPVARTATTRRGPLSGSASGGRPSNGRAASVDEVEHPEDRHVESHDHGADDGTEEGDHQGLDQRGEGLRGRLDLLVVEVGD